MTPLEHIQRLWLAAMLFFLGLAQLLFDGSGNAHSSYPAMVTLVLLVLCFPSSVFALMVNAFAFDQLVEASPDVLIRNGRSQLVLFWSIFLAFGAVQWFLLPALWRALRLANPTKPPG